MAAAGQEFADYVVGQMTLFGPVRACRMFGGFGLYHQGLMFALVIAEQLYFKVDDTTVSAFTQRQLSPFTYTARGRTVALSYYEAPAEVFDEPEAMAHWAATAFACALRAAAAKKPRRRPAGKRR